MNPGTNEVPTGGREVTQREQIANLKEQLEAQENIAWIQAVMIKAKNGEIAALREAVDWYFECEWFCHTGQWANRKITAAGFMEMSAISKAAEAALKGEAPK